ncbi:hypothetical protein AB0M20_27335 [Actinoplanes sp. NPDC051633]|uniref:hypothetical protein n=1 Tax=Actinoplanes sp. NPDC051633 TaxID=3155670 RepID=UPI00343A1C01
MATAVATPPAGIAAFSRAVVAAAADLVGSVERAVVGDQRVRTARDNAWDAMCADRARAQARDEMEALVRAILAEGPRPAVTAARPAMRPANQPATQPAAQPAGRRRAAKTRRLATTAAG